VRRPMPYQMGRVKGLRQRPWWTVANEYPLTGKLGSLASKAAAVVQFAAQETNAGAHLVEPGLR
jgi:hypothetical protein